jgi:hypothetical protein
VAPTEVVAGVVAPAVEVVEAVVVGVVTTNGTSMRVVEAMAVP